MYNTKKSFLQTHVKKTVQTIIKGRVEKIEFGSIWKKKLKVKVENDPC